ncbi:MAG: thiol reductant ABC exporter subunit CydC [Actinobacteria bacterium HGW-Actinobacteria-4]|nr:MAG: thiol reductant ABC exporter subunit CydC [Actinobacteria bacterium HGW-Actinobacteria-4]
MRPLIAALRDTGVRPAQIALAVAAGTMALGSAVGLAAVAAWLIARAAEMPSPADIALAAVIVRFFGITRGLFRYLERLASHNTALSGVVTLRERVYTRLADNTADRVLSLSRGEIVARLGADLDSVGDAVVRAIIPVGVAVTVSLLAVGIVGSQLPIAGAALAVCLVLAGLVPAVLTWRSASIAATMGTLAHARVSVAALSSIEAATEHRVWGTREATSAELAQANADAELAQEATARPAAWSAGTQTLLSGLALIAGVGFAVVAIRAGDISGPAGAMVALTPLAAFEAVGAIPNAIQQLFRSRAAAQRLDEAVGSGDGATTPGPSVGSTTAAPLFLRDLSAAWPGMTPTRPVSTTVPPGSCLAITGASGVGKTTLLLTIAGAMQPHAGTVGLGDAAVTASDTGAVIAMTAEDAHIFGTTVLENLRVACGNVTETQARGALDTVGLDAWVNRLPGGIDTELGSGGHTVSGGERRRLLLARTLLATAPIHLIDEPSEHLDDAGIAAFRNMIAQMRAEGRTVVVVTHDAALLDIADQVVSLDV